MDGFLYSGPSSSTSLQSFSSSEMSTKVIKSSVSTASSTEPAQTSNRVWLTKTKKYAATILHHFKKHVGVGVVCSVAYFDPGNWSVDLQAGSEFGYKLLFIVLLSGLFAVVFQAMAAKLGCVTGMDLATHCRMLLYNRPKYTKFYRWCILYPLYVLAEVAIISTDLAELLGSATALTLLFPSLPLWGGVLLTTVDVLFLLALQDPTRAKPARMFEFLIGILVVAVFGCLIVVIVKVSVNWGQAFKGFLPSETVVGPSALYISVGIIGATVMPHGLFLGSSLARADRVGDTTFVDPDASTESLAKPMPMPIASRAERRSPTFWAGRFLSAMSPSRMMQDDSNRGLPDCRKGYAAWENNPLTFVRAHLKHGVTDVVASLLGFAVAINSLILILAAAVFYSLADGGELASDLFQAHTVIYNLVGKPAAILFAVSLLAAGQSASITATVAGQVVSEGFIRWHVSPILRRLLTRMLGLIPSMVVAIVVGRSGINTLLVLSQVVLSIVLPFVAFPLVYLTSSKKHMAVKDDGYVVSSSGSSTREKADMDLADPVPENAINVITYTGDNESQNSTRIVDFSNGWIMTILGWAIWLLIVIANGYVLITLMLGEE